MKEKVEKSMSGRYKDNSENRRLHRVGQEYHHGSQQGSDSENERQIKALQSKIEQMQKNKHIFIEQGGEMRYNRALGVLQGKLNDLQNSRKVPAEKGGGSGNKNEVVHDINGVKVKVTKNSNGSYTLEANGKKFKTDDPSYFVFGTDIKPRVKAALAKEVGIESQKPTETSENNEERQKIADRVEKVFAKVAADENVEQTLLREYVKNKIKDSAFDTEILTSKVKDNLNKMIGHLNETKEGKEVLKELKKINETSKRKKKYGDMNVEEAKKELLGKDLTITDIETGKTRTEKITSILEGNVRGHETVMARVEGGGTYPIKHIDTGKEWRAWKLNLNSSSKETKSEQVKQVSSLKEELDHHNNELDNLENKKEDYIKQHGEEKYNERHKKIEDKIEDTRKELDNLKGSDKTGGSEEKETFTRVKFDDVPNSGKVNLKKYLSSKRQKVVDERWGSISKITDADLKKMEQGLVNKFNEGFESSSKAQRAEDLYHIMKVKGEIAKRSKKN